jgi:glycosyltransferase involved in cell wall biosynthesis
MNVTIFCIITRQFIEHLMKHDQMISNYDFQLINNHIGIYLNNNLIQIIYCCRRNNQTNESWVQYIESIVNSIVCDCEGCLKTRTTDIVGMNDCGFCRNINTSSKPMTIKPMVTNPDSKPITIKPMVTNPDSKPMTIKPMINVVYLVNNSLPLNTSGYTVRSHEILKNMNHHNVKMFCVNKLICDPSHDKIINKDNIEYNYLTTDKKIIQSSPDNLYDTEYLNEYCDKLYEFCVNNKINIIHACSNYLNAMAGYNVANKLNIRCIYEVRGLWHLSRASFVPGFISSSQFTEYEKLENDIIKKCDAVITINSLIKNRIHNNKILIVPNCVNTLHFSQKNTDNKHLINRYQLSGNLVIGYVGSTVNYEGLDTLVRAISILVIQKLKIKLLIVGKGSTKSCTDTFNTLEKLIKELKLSKTIYLVGQIDKSVVKKYYEVMDIVCIPRKNHLVCDIVPPIKIFEAMSMEKTVIVSDVKPLVAIIRHGHNGLVFKSENVTDLSIKIKSIYNDRSRMTEYGKNARQQVIDENQWSVHLQSMVDLYFDCCDNT